MLLSVDTSSYIFDTKASLRVMIASLQSAVSLRVLFLIATHCVSSLIYCVQCVVCQFGIKQGQTLALILGDVLEVIFISKKCTHAAEL